MRFIKITGDLKTLPTDCKSWYFAATCGNGPTTMSSTSSFESCSVLVPFSSPNVATGELKLQLYAHKVLSGQEKEQEGGQEEKGEKIEANAAVLVATRSVTVHTNESSHASDFKLKSSAGDLIETTASFTHVWLPAPLHSAMLPALRSPHVAITSSASFSSPALREDLSLRVLNAEGACLGTASIPASGTASALIVLAPCYKDQPLELSVASKTAGVFSTPLELGTPLVSKISTEDDEEDDGERERADGCMLLSTLVRAYAGTAETATAAGVGGAEGQESHMLSFGTVTHHSIRSEPKEEEEEEEEGGQKESSPVSDMIVYHLEALQQPGEGYSYAHDSSRDHLVMAGVLEGPVLSRLDLPKQYHAQHAEPAFGSRCQYFVDTSRSYTHTTAEQQDVAASIKEFQAQNGPNNLLYLHHHNTQQLPLSSTLPPLAARLSVLAVRSNTCADSSDSAEEKDKSKDKDEKVRVLASCLLTEAHRSVLPRDESNIPDDKGASSSTPAVTFADPEFVLLRGTVDYVAPSSSPGPSRFQLSDTFELPCALVSLAPFSSPSSTPSKMTKPTPQVNNEEDLLSLQSSRSALIEPVPAQTLESSQNSSTQSLLNELGRILHKEGEGPTKDESTGKGSDQKRLIDVLTNELLEKQRLIDRLLSDNNTKTQTITEQAASGESLRQEISKLHISLAESRAALSYREQESNAAVRLAEDGVDSPASLQQYSRPVLIQAVIECCNRLKHVDQERLDLKRVIGDSVSVRKQYIALTKTYQELQTAHLAQSKHIQKMQKQYEKVKTYQNTIVMQEKVISKMQSVIESHLRAASQAVPLSASLPSRHQDNQKQPAFTDKKDLHQQQQQYQVQTPLSAQVAKLNAEIASKDIRIEALQDQLTISATEASREIASLRTRLFELEIAGHGSSVSGDENHYGGGGGELGGDGNDFLPLSKSLSNDLFLVPFQQSLKKDNEHLRQEVISARSSKAHLQSNGGGGRAGLTTGASFVDLSGTRHHSREDDHSASVNVPSLLSSSISLANAYRPNSISGSPRPRSPSEQQTERSSLPPRTSASARNSARNSEHHSEQGSRRSSRTRMSGEGDMSDDHQQKEQLQGGSQGSQVSSKVNSRVVSRVASPVINSRGSSYVDQLGNNNIGNSSRRGSASRREKEESPSPSRENLLVF